MISYTFSAKRWAESGWRDHERDVERKMVEFLTGQDPASIVEEVCVFFF